KFTSVSYDQSEDKFVISGNSGVDQPRQFIGTIENDGSLVQLAQIPAKHLSLATPPNTYILSEKTNKHVLSGYSNGIAYLVQDIRDTSANYGDGIWVSEVNYLTGVVNWSIIYKFPPVKVNVISVAQNYMNLYVLGHHNGLDQNNPFERRYIAQIDLSNPLDYIVKLMSDENWWGSSMPSTYYSTEQMYLSSLNFNEATYNVYASGATLLGDAYLIEINDLMYDYCDIDRIVTTPSFVCACYSPMSEVILETMNANITKRPSTPTTYSIDNSLLCGDIYKAELRNEELKLKIENKKLENTLNQQLDKEMKVVASIKVYENYFTCNNFEDVCNYKIFDIFGRIIQEGTTHNHKETEIIIKTVGTYLIQITDNKGNVKTEKVFVK
ncbi:MAG: T9SS type A sorting domain-containing protein, partial [Bacteroidales bacterium]|nr:T9SS type A sorting domain-containing protein [Bacteroidales bacterium]